MNRIEFRPFHPDLDPATTIMIDGYAPGFRMISHWPGHGTAEALRHDLTTGSALRYAEMGEAERKDVVGEFSSITNNHYDTDGALSLFAMLQPEIALRHRDLILRTARAGDFAVWGGTDALALELSIMSDLAPFLPFTTPPFDEERIGNLSRLYRRTFDRLEALLADPFALRDEWAARYDHIVLDIARLERNDGVSVTRFPEDDLAVVESDRPITAFGLRLVAGDLFRVLLVHPTDTGNRYRFCFRGESWWDVVSVRPLPRVPLARLAERLNRLEATAQGRWWSAPGDWVVPELGYGEPVTFELLAVRFDPQTEQDPPSTLPTDVVVRELREALRTYEPYDPAAVSADTPQTTD